MPKKILNILISLTIIPIAVFSVQRFSPSPIGSTAIWWLIEAMILFVFIVARFFFFEAENKRHLRFLKWYLIWITFCIVRGIFMAEMYWDYKILIENTFALFIPVVVYVVSNKERLQLILSYFIKYALPLSILILPFLSGGVWGWYLFPISFLMLFFPVLKFKWKIILLVISFAAILGDISVRSHILKYSIPILLLLLYYLRIFVVSVRTLEFTRKILMFIPWMLFLLAVLGIFNVFKIGEYIQGDHSGFTFNSQGERVQGMANDSRTFMYEEVLASAKKYNYWIIGRSPARGNETFAFASFFEEITGRNERYRNEANIPNVFTWMGIIGVILYFLVFYKASYLAINRSRNIFSKLIGLFVAFRWAYAWVEDYYEFDMNNFVIWLMIGACFSQSFRKMNNAEVILWARGIFQSKYIHYMNYFDKNNPKTTTKFS